LEEAFFDFCTVKLSAKREDILETIGHRRSPDLTSEIASSIISEITHVLDNEYSTLDLENSFNENKFDSATPNYNTNIQNYVDRISDHIALTIDETSTSDIPISPALLFDYKKDELIEFLETITQPTHKYISDNSETIIADIEVELIMSLES
jgi:hypothetical protein